MEPVNGTRDTTYAASPRCFPAQADEAGWCLLDADGVSLPATPTGTPRDASPHGHKRGALLNPSPTPHGGSSSRLAPSTASSTSSIPSMAGAAGGGAGAAACAGGEGAAGPGARLAVELQVHRPSQQEHVRMLISAQQPAQAPAHAAPAPAPRTPPASSAAPHTATASWAAAPAASCWERYIRTTPPPGPAAQPSSSRDDGRSSGEGAGQAGAGQSEGQAGKEADAGAQGGSGKEGGEGTAQAGKQGGRGHHLLLMPWRLVASLPLVPAVVLSTLLCCLAAHQLLRHRRSCVAAGGAGMQGVIGGAGTDEGRGYEAT